MRIKILMGIGDDQFVGFFMWWANFSERHFLLFIQIWRLVGAELGQFLSASFSKQNIRAFNIVYYLKHIGYCDKDDYGTTYNQLSMVN